LLTNLRLENFRGFEDHSLPLKPATVLVGRNNAGKSTIAEALRLVSLVANRYEFLNFRPPPAWLDIPARFRGVSPSLRDFDFNSENVFYRYRDPPASITATFATGAGVRVFIGPEGNVHGVILGKAGEPVTTKAEARRFDLPAVNILPQVAPLAREERILSPFTIRGALFTTLASSHFRNQLNYFYENFFNRFRETAEASWPGLRIRELTGRGTWPEERDLSLLVQDGDFVAEVGWMGHGLQMWLQTMWFLTLAGGGSTVILDEPDVYMHPDLQRHLVRFLRGRFSQWIIATHSVEIMAEVDPEAILVADRVRPKSSFSTSLGAVQQVVERIGGVHNLHLARLWSARKCILVEGKDLKILKHLQNRLFPWSDEPLDAVPNMSIGGWDGWPYAIGSSMLMKNAIDERIIVYCILDSDYHTPEEKEERQREAGDRDVNLHIWKKKEIENYLVVPAALQRVITSRIGRRVQPPSAEEVEEQLERIAESLKDSATDAIATEILARDRKGLVAANRAARRVVAGSWDSLESKLSIVSGKGVVSAMSEWSQAEFGAGFGPIAVARALEHDEIEPELFDMLNAIEEAVPF
jgi:hypothetical protein